jgi:hypothetical protein
MQPDNDEKTEDELDDTLLRKKIQRRNQSHNSPCFESPEILTRKEGKSIFNKINESYKEYEKKIDIVNIRQIEENSLISQIRREIENLEYIDKQLVKQIIENLRSKGNPNDPIYELFFQKINSLLETDCEITKQSFLNCIYSHERWIHERRNIYNSLPYVIKSSPGLTPGTNTNSGKTFHDGIQSPNLDMYNLIPENSPYTNSNIQNYFYNHYLNIITSPLNIHSYSPLILPSPFTNRQSEQPVKQSNQGGFTDLVKSLNYKTNK